MTADHVLIPVHIAVDSKFISRRLYDLTEGICHLVDALGSKRSLIVVFQIQEYRKLDPASI